MQLFNKIPSPQINLTIIRNISLRKVKNWYATLHKPSKPDPPYNHVAQIGDPVLRQKTELVPIASIKSEEIKFLIKILKSVMNKYDCCGLAAPQIGVPLRVFAIEFESKRRREFTPEMFNSRKMSIVPFSVFINPEIKVINYNKIVFPEACESVRGFKADVPRYSEIELTGYNENGDEVKVVADGWTSRIIQHEMDHLDGKMYTDIMDRKTLSCCCWQEVNVHCGKIELSFLPS